MRFVKMDKQFFGRQQTRESLDNPLPWVCAYIAIEPDGAWDGNGGEAVLHENKVVGSTASVVYGHTVGKILAFAYVRPSAAAPGTHLEVVIAGEPRAAQVLGEPAYDPQGLLPRTDAALEVAE
jgi:dimethylglycine dehydrogenase